jgi:hypothetical protein
MGMEPWFFPWWPIAFCLDSKIRLEATARLLPFSMPVVDTGSRNAGLLPTIRDEERYRFDDSGHDRLVALESVAVTPASLTAKDGHGRTRAWPEILGGGARIRTGVRGFAGPCLNHSATPP